MATSTVACFLFSAVLWIAAASAQSVSPSNNSLGLTTQLTLQNTGTDLNRNSFNIAPLTEAVGLGGSQTAVNANTFTGTLIEVGPNNELNVTSADIAYISCDPNSDSSNLDPTNVVSTVGSAKPQGIVLYSISSENCNLTGTFPSTNIYTMTSSADSQTLLHGIQLELNSIRAKVGANSTLVPDGGSNTNNDGGPAPTTAVAMSILYSITGIITLLFLIIIATGAIRAHRHPERYGPRTGLAGRPRQSRAKGLARAMLETLPIVKFGDPEPVKPGSRDIELEDGNTSVHNPAEAVTVPEATSSDKSKQTTVVTGVESGMGPAQAESIKSGQEATKTEGELGCSICTEDFTTGEDVRVLPCHHKYHPACIDPWLLNVSGTCPLCRHDLRPVAATTDAPTDDSGLAPPLSAAEGGDTVVDNTETAEGDNASTNPQRRRVSRFLDLNRLRHAPPDERIAALRRL